jgi:hypothetical protein
MLNGALTPSRWQCKITIGKEPETFSPLDGRNTSPEPIARPSYIQAPYRIPTLHAFSRSVIYFFLDAELVPITDAITVHAVASTGEKVAADIPLERINPESPTIHHLAAKTLMNVLVM